MKLEKRNTIFILLITASVVSFIIFYAGHFLFNGTKQAPGTAVDQTDSSAVTEKSREFPIKYKHFNEMIKNSKQEIHLVEIDLADPRVKIVPVLSHDRVYGYEKLSSMAERSSAYAAVNGGFFYEYGLPGGGVAIDGEWITAATGKFPVFAVIDGKAELRELKSGLWVQYQGKRLRIDKINSPGNGKQIVLYTPAYGSTNRADRANITAVIEDNRIMRIATGKGETDIPENGVLLTFFNTQGSDLSTLALKAGDRIELQYEPRLGRQDQVYECGSWIVKDGQIVIAERDEWVGVFTNRDPRTVIGLKEDNTVVLLAADGRQPGYSEGLTGRELGDLLLRYGIKNAAMLDGGASTEMIVRGRMVNRPSFKGQERPLGGGIIVQVKD